MKSVSVDKLARLQDFWQTKADEYQRLGVGTTNCEQGTRYVEKAASYRRAIRDLQDVIDSSAVAPPFAPDESDIAAMSDRDFR